MQRVSDIMTRDVLSVAPNALIEDALDLMLEKRISGLPVIDEAGHLVGLVSEFDVLVLLGRSESHYGPVAPVGHFMTIDVDTVAEDLPLSELLEVFNTRPIRRLPVVKGDRLIGIVSRRDLIRAIRADYIFFHTNLTNWFIYSSRNL